MIYNSLILSRINYGFLAWGYNSERIFKLQKKAVRLITLAKFNAHSEPIFKSLILLKVQDIFEICQMKFYHNYLNKKLPHFFNQISFQNNNQIHHYETRINSQCFVYIYVCVYVCVIYKAITINYFRSTEIVFSITDIIN